MDIYGCTEFIERLIQNAKVSEALNRAYNRFYEKRDAESFANLVNALTTARRIKDLEDLYHRFPEMFERKRDTLAVLLFRSLRLKDLHDTLPGVDALTRGWILASLGYVREAHREWERLDVKRGFLKVYLDLLMGNDPGEIEAIGDSPMSVLYRDYLRGTFLATAGMVEEGLRVLNSVAFRAFEGGYVGWGIDTILLKGFLGLNPTEIEAGRYIASHLGDRFSVVLSDIYLAPFREEVPDVPDVPRFTVQREYADALISGRPLPTKGPFGYRAHWWYVEKFRRNRRFITFAGRVRVMEGRREIHLERPRRSIAVLTFHRVLGEEGKRWAHLIFQNSKDPRRRYEEHLGRLREFRNVPMDLFITRRYGTFLSLEDEPWAEFVKDRVLGSNPSGG